METNEAQPNTLLSHDIGCPECGKRFRNQIGLRMHHLRIHSGRGWDTGANFKKGKSSKEEGLAKKREYNRVMRERYYKEGRNSRGEKMPDGWTPRLYGNTSKMRSMGWSLERREKFNKTWRSKIKAKHKQVQIVYPDPRQKAMEEETRPEKAAVRTPDHCPHCGENIRAWRYEP